MANIKNEYIISMHSCDNLTNILTRIFIISQTIRYKSNYEYMKKHYNDYINIIDDIIRVKDLIGLRKKLYQEYFTLYAEYIKNDEDVSEYVKNRKRHH